MARTKKNVDKRSQNRKNNQACRSSRKRDLTSIEVKLRRMERARERKQKSRESIAKEKAKKW